MPEPISLSSYLLSMMIMIPFLLTGLVLTVIVLAICDLPFVIFPVKPLTPQYSDSGNYIEDNIGVIDNYEYLNTTLGEFQELTGICPYIITVYDSDWESHYSSLENYSYDLYVNHFYDEQHFLIVYSEPAVYESDGFVDWSWEGMQGDDTDSIITSGKFSEFQGDLQRYLLMNDYTVGEAFEQAFRNSLDYMMENDHETSYDSLPMFCIVVFWDVILVFCIFSMTISFIKSKRNYEMVPMSEAAPGSSPANPGYDQDWNQQSSQSVNQGYYYGNDETPGENDPYSENTDRGYNLNGEENGKL